jgi:hypothetical protein
VLFNPDDKADFKIDRVKRTLARDKPVVIGMVVLQNFLSLRSGDDVWYPSVGKTDLFGGHAMVVVGYDDGKKAFEIMNSWGRGWANEGFVWVRYEDFAKYCKYAYQLVLEKEESKYLEGKIRIIKPVVRTVSDGEADVVFSPVAFEYENNLYRLKEESLHLPLEFQLVAEGLRKDSYLYVISFDKSLKPSVHWPRDEKLNRQFLKEHESPLITAEHAQITLPGKYNVFSISDPVTEHLCVLNSSSPLRNLPEKLRQINAMKGDLPERVRKVFNTNPDSEYSEFENDAIRFYVDGSKAEVVSFLLEFNVSK